MGAWIEICELEKQNIDCFVSHPTMGAWIEMALTKPKEVIHQVAPHDGCVDWNLSV